MGYAKRDTWRAHILTCERGRLEKLNDIRGLEEGGRESRGGIDTTASEIQRLRDEIASLDEEIALRAPQAEWGYYANRR